MRTKGDDGPDAAIAASHSAPGPIIEVDAIGRVGSCTTCTRVRSFRHPLCVEGTENVIERIGLAVLDAADRAWDTVVGALGAPPPDGSSDGLWHIELIDAVDGGGDARLEARNAVARLDRASSYAIVDGSLRPGCALDRALARAVARGSLWRLAPATDSASARAEIETLARLATTCADEEGAADRAAFEAQPERTIVDPVSSSYERGASLFFDWLDATFGKRPGAFVLGLWALAPTLTPAHASRWSGSPNGFDVLGASLRDTLWAGSTLEDVFVRFAVHRLQIDPPPRPTWQLEWPTHARRIASREPIAPTGASYVVVRHDGAPRGSRLRVEIEWEDYARLRWTVVKLDAAGRSLGELSIPSLDRAPHASMTVESIDGVDRLMIVGVNVGSTDHPFDPYQGDWEPHGWRVTVAADEIR